MASQELIERLQRIVNHSAHADPMEVLAACSAAIQALQNVPQKVGPDVMNALAKRVALFRKERHLRANPMMDEVAVKLNRQPRWDEIRFVEQFIEDLRACGATVTEGKSGSQL